MKDVIEICGKEYIQATTLMKQWGISYNGLSLCIRGRKLL